MSARGELRGLLSPTAAMATLAALVAVPYAVPGLVRGVTSGPGREVRIGPPGQPIHNLDALPFPARQ